MIQIKNNKFAKKFKKIITKNKPKEWQKENLIYLKEKKNSKR